MVVGIFIVRSSRNCQILLFSATFSEKVRNFAVKCVRNANQVFVRKEDLSLDVIKQHRVECPREADREEVNHKSIIRNHESRISSHESRN